MTILVAGGAGFIGSHLCDFLVSAGNSVIVVDNLITGRIQNLDQLDGRIRFIEADIRQPWHEWLAQDQAQQISQIYNLASPASPIDFAKMPEFILTTASQGHRNLLQLAVGLQKSKNTQIPVLFASTSEVYGDPLEHPQSETYWGNVNSIGERSCYDEAKRFGEALSACYRREHGLSAKIARIFNTYGPRMRPTDGRVISNFFNQAMARQPFSIYGSGEQTRSFCYVNDLVRGLFLLMQSQHLGPVNIGNPAEITIRQLATSVAQIANVPLSIQELPLPSDDPKRRKPDISLAYQLLNWKPEVSLLHGLKQMWDFSHNVDSQQ